VGEVVRATHLNWTLFVLGRREFWLQKVENNQRLHLDHVDGEVSDGNNAWMQYRYYGL